jgi:hypothetical protein
MCDRADPRVSKFDLWPVLPYKYKHNIRIYSYYKLHGMHACIEVIILIIMIRIEVLKV